MTTEAENRRRKIGLLTVEDAWTAEDDALVTEAVREEFMSLTEDLPKQRTLAEIADICVPWPRIIDPVRESGHVRNVDRVGVTTHFDAYDVASYHEPLSLHALRAYSEARGFVQKHKVLAPRFEVWVLRVHVDPYLVMRVNAPVGGYAYHVLAQWDEPVPHFRTDRGQPKEELQTLPRPYKLRWYERWTAPGL